MNGWQQDVLARAIKTCTDPSGIVQSCKEFTFYEQSEYQECVKPSLVDEEVMGPLKKLPGCNSIYDGPGYAPLNACDNARDSIAQPTSKPYSKPKPGHSEPKLEQNEFKPGESEPKPGQKVPNPEQSEPKSKAEDLLYKASHSESKPEACNPKDGPHVVVVTETKTVKGARKTRAIAPGPPAYVVHTADANVVTVTAPGYVKRELAQHHHRRRHAFGHKL